MYRFITSTHLEDLAEALARHLRSDRPEDPLQPVGIIVPNRDHARWLTLRLAEHNGVAANLRFLLPSEWLWRLIRSMHPDLPDLLPSDPMPMTWNIWNLLSDQREVEKMPVLRLWLERQGAARRLRQWQLARQIASVFDQYQVYRPEMVMRWEETPPDLSVSERAEGWQHYLWSRLNKEWNRLFTKGIQSRARLTHQLENALAAGEMVPRQPVLLFNPGPLPPPVRRLLERIAQQGRVIHFGLLATFHFPENFGEKSQGGDQNGALLESDRDPGTAPPVRNTGSPGVEKRLQTDLLLPSRQRSPLMEAFGEEQLQQVTLLRQFARKNPGLLQVDLLPERFPGDHSLGRVQSSIRRGDPFPSLISDGSIVIRSCHSPLREVEELHQYLIGLFSRHPDLDPGEILIVTPDLETYRPYLEAVFSVAEKGLPRIPFHIAGSGNRRSDPVRAFFRLLALPDSRFERSDVLEFLRETAVAERFRLSPQDLLRIGEWIEENRVSWGMDGEHRSRFGQPCEELHTWRLALRRGWYGQLVTSRPGTLHKEMLLYPDIVTTDDRELWAILQKVLRLLDEVRRDIEDDRTAEEWEAVVNRWIGSFLPRGSSRESEVQQIRLLVRQLVREIHSAGVSGKIPYGLIRTALEEQLESTASGSSSFTRGVVIHSMVPVRSIPFRVVALLGLNEELFPRRPVRPDYDLMAGTVRPGERDRKREDRNLFLESVMAAGEVHYSSYVGRNQKDDEPVPPSVILDEWIQLVSDALPEGTEPVRTAPLTGFSPRCFVQGDAGDAGDQNGIPAHAAGAADGSWSMVYFETADLLRKPARQRGLLVDRELQPEPGESGSILLADLERYYRNPLREYFGLLGVRLELDEEGEEEVFVTSPLDNHQLHERVFAWTLEGMRSEEMLSLLQQSGRVPAGWPGRKDLYRIIAAVRESIRQIREKGHPPGSVRRIVSTPVSGEVLHGEVRSWSEEGMLDLHFSKENGSRLLMSWIRHLILSQMDEDFNETHVLLNLKKNDGNPVWRRFGREESAGQCLSEIVRLYREGMKEPRSLFLEAAYCYARKMDESVEEAWSEAVRKWEDEYSAFGERVDPYTELLLGPDADPDPVRIPEVAELLFLPMIRNLNRKG